MGNERHATYAVVYRDKIQATAAARGLFAEVYELFRARGIEVELLPFLPDSAEVPQFARLDGFNVNDGGFRPLIHFAVENSSDWNAKGFFVEVRFEPDYNIRKVSGFDQLVTVHRNFKRTPNAMNPQSIAEFVLKYVDAARKRQSALDDNRARAVLKEIRVKANEEAARTLQKRERKGRAYVYASRDGHENELHLTLSGTAAEVRHALSLLDAAFPLPQTTISRE